MLKTKRLSWVSQQDMVSDILKVLGYKIAWDTISNIPLSTLSDVFLCTTVRQKGPLAREASPHACDAIQTSETFLWDLSPPYENGRDRSGASQETFPSSRWFVNYWKFLHLLLKQQCLSETGNLIPQARGLIIKEPSSLPLVISLFLYIFLVAYVWTDQTPACKWNPNHWYLEKPGLTQEKIWFWNTRT